MPTARRQGMSPPANVPAELAPHHGGSEPERRPHLGAFHGCGQCLSNGITITSYRQSMSGDGFLAGCGR
jgi:hypothetical protein